MAIESRRLLTGRRDSTEDEPQTLAEIAMTPEEVIDDAVAHPDRALQTNNPLYGNIMAMRTSLLTEMEDATPEEWQTAYTNLAIQTLQTPPENDPLRPINTAMIQANVAFTYVMGRIIEGNIPDTWTQINQDIQTLAHSSQEQAARGLQPEAAQAISRRFTALFAPPPAAK